MSRFQLLGSLLIVFGCYEVWHGFFNSRINRLRFLIVGGFLTGVPFLLGGTFLVFARGTRFERWTWAIFVLWAFGVVWETRMRWKVRRRESEDEVE